MLYVLDEALLVLAQVFELVLQIQVDSARKEALVGRFPCIQIQDEAPLVSVLD